MLPYHDGENKVVCTWVFIEATITALVNFSLTWMRH